MTIIKPKSIAKGVSNIAKKAYYKTTGTKTMHLGSGINDSYIQLKTSSVPRIKLVKNALKNLLGIK